MEEGGETAFPVADMKDFNETVSALGFVNNDIHCIAYPKLLLVVHRDLSTVTVVQSFMRINDFFKQLHDPHREHTNLYNWGKNQASFPQMHKLVCSR